MMKPKNFRAVTPKQVLSQISRELGPDAIIVSHKEIQDSKGRLWVEAAASPNAEELNPESITLTADEKTLKFSSKKLFMPALVFIALIIAGAITWQFLLRKTAVNPSPKMHSVAVINFENQTGDNSYDYLNKVIPNLLITSLEQSGYFHVTSWERLNDLLKQMGKEDLEVIDNDLGFELCQMDDVDAIVLGSFAKAGDMFVTDVKVLDVETKKILKSASSRGQGEESIIQSQIDELGREISQGIGIPEHKIEGNPMRIGDVTTNSLDAYNYFLKGQRYFHEYQWEHARGLLEKAVELDPSFAMAYLFLGATFSMLGEGDASTEAYKKAMLHSARAIEKVRLFIEVRYAYKVEKDLDKSLRLGRKLVSLYPKEKIFHRVLGDHYDEKKLLNQAIEEYSKALELDPYDHKTLDKLADTYRKVKNYGKAIEHLKKSASILPGNYWAFWFMGNVYLDMGKLDEALEAYREGAELDPRMVWIIPYIYALKEDYAEAISWIDRSVNTATTFEKGWMYFEKSFYQYWLGSLDKSMSNLRRQIESSDTTGITQGKANADWMMGWIFLDRDEFELCREHFKSWFEIYMQNVLPERPNSAAIKPHWTAWYYFYLGLVDLKQGNIESAKSRLVEINSLLPDVIPAYKNWVSFYYDFLQAEVLLAEGAADKAITLCEKSSPLGGSVELGNMVLYNVPFLKDVLARAYRQNGEIDKAIAEYERLIVFDPQREERYLIHPKYYYRLAQLYEQKGLKMEAIVHYEKFLNLWRDADPDIPEVIEAKKRFSKLQSFP